MATKKTPTRGKVSSVAQFKNKTGGLVELPSGLSVKVRNANGLRGFVESGMIPNSLMNIVQEAIKTGKEPDMSGVVTEEGIDPKMVADMLLMLDNVVQKVVVDPPVHPLPESEEDRDDELLYIDELDEEDKMFIFQWVTGGTRDLEQFHQELADGVDHLAKLPYAQSKTKQPARTRR